MNGRKILATGPTKNAQIRVPIPIDPPKRNPIATKEISTIIRTTPKFFLSLSDKQIATKSFGPVPASDFITIVIPKAKIIHPKPLISILRTREFIFVKGPLKIAVKKSIIGPPKIIQSMVPIFM